MLSRSETDAAKFAEGHRASSTLPGDGTWATYVGFYCGPMTDGRRKTRGHGA